MDTKKRPTSVTVIGWILIVIGGLNLVILLMGFQPFESVGWTIVHFWSFVGAAVVMISAIAILKGLNWGRLLYLIFVPVSIVLQWLVYGFNPANVGGVIFYIVILVFLTSPAASTFFTSGNSGESKLTVARRKIK